MRRRGYLSIVIALGLLVGCDKPAANMNAKPAPSGGAMFPIPGHDGFVAVVTEGVDSPRGSRRKSHALTIVATFYQGDGKTAFEPTPTDVNVKIGVSDDSPMISLVPSPGDAKLASRFASPQADYPEGLQGVVSAKINGKLVEVPISAR
jgi:hypothetical protein